ncbi:hypothetical protein [Flavobacterium hydatis]|uniref:Lipoprotein n=1 Tax=Flavobacterium hydatis TaxID=991 RepID=A0A086AGH7_FLAHY|nr:hypothetical protein [Flavobacterium hydatis]KFF15791.1 hypothetical protein IW20_12880 [Flavobacterium hydatis]OXA85960.1 hypothetical protein B0A62_23915 [Flavobacterium hydatis]
MKRILLFLIFLLFVSCNESELKRQQIKSGFINKPGIYSVFQRDLKTKKIVLKQFKDESIIFAITDFHNKILFQQELNKTFSPYHYWCLYVDEQANVWFYNSDYSSSKAIILNPDTQLYEVKDFCEIKLILPTEFRKELEVKNTFTNCKSFN